MTVVKPSAAVRDKGKRGGGSELRRAFTGLRRGETIAGYLFLLPNFLGFIVFMLFPILFAFYIMLTDWSLAKPPQFVGLDNFNTMVNDRLFWKSLGNSFYYTFVAVPTGIFIAFWLALALNRKMRGIIFFRTIYFLPQITLTVAAATIWRWIYQPELGLINYILGLIGIDGPNWIHDTRWAMPAVIIMSNWQGIGFAMLILLAGLQGIPEEYYEAAAIDGASEMQRMRFVTLPMLSPAIFFVVVTSLINAFQSFRSILHIDARRAGACHDAADALHISERIQFLQDGLWRGTGSGAIRDHLDHYPGAVAIRAALGPWL